MPHPSLDTKILTGQGIRKLNHEKRVKLIRQVQMAGNPKEKYYHEKVQRVGEYFNLGKIV